MDKNVKTFSLRKKILYSFLPLLFLMLFGEIAARCIYFQVKNDSSFAMVRAFYVVSHKIKLKRSKSFKEDYQQKYMGTWEALFSEKGCELLLEFEKEYEQYFSKLVLSAKNAQTKLIVLYLPSTQPDTDKSDSESICRNYFQHLAEKYGVKYLDFTDYLRNYNWEDITLLPQDGHLSRFANRIIANKLNESLKEFYNYRSPLKMISHIDVYGDLKPLQKDICNVNSRMPYQVITNSQGFRNIHELKVKKRQRILILGDSFTFGPYLPNHDTYPALLAQINPKIDVVNAGICGYTIIDETSLFVERAQFIAPDVTILQVLDNDIYGLFCFKKNKFSRKRETYFPTSLEESFLQKTAALNN